VSLSLDWINIDNKHQIAIYAIKIRKAMIFKILEFLFSKPVLPYVDCSNKIHLAAQTLRI
jgi:hypothetical protein